MRSPVVHRWIPCGESVGGGRGDRHNDHDGGPAGPGRRRLRGADDHLGPTASGILTSGGGDARVPIASVSKLITKMVVLDHRPLGTSGASPAIIFDKTAHALSDKYFVLNATIAAMPTGSSMTEHDALETASVPHSGQIARDDRFRDGPRARPE